MDEFEKQLAAQLKQASKVKTKKKKKTSKLKLDGTPKKKTGTKPKPVIPDSIIPAKVCQAGKSEKQQKKLSVKERDRLKLQLVQYYGSSKVDKYLLGCISMIDLNERLCRMRDNMENDIDRELENSDKYFKKIDDDFKKIGRPNAPFTFQELDFLCSIGCTLPEIAGFFDMHRDSIRHKVKNEYGMPFNQYYERRSQGIKIALRRSQIVNAISGDTAMQKFLGINMLGQKNKVDFEGKVQVNTFADLVKSLDNKTNGNDSEEQGDED